MSIGPRHGATAKRRRGTTAAKKGLVDVVMQDSTEPLLIFAAEPSRERLGKGVADRVGVAQAFALNDFHGVIDAFERRYDDLTHNPWPTSARPSNIGAYRGGAFARRFSPISARH